MKTLIMTILLIFSAGCTSSIMTAYGLRSVDTHYGKECEKMGYTKMTDDWRECIMEHRRTRPNVTRADRSDTWGPGNEHYDRGMCAANGTC